MLVYNERKYQKAVGKEIFISFGGKINKEYDNNQGSVYKLLNLCL